jgi:hypothetical protein
MHYHLAPLPNHFSIERNFYAEGKLTLYFLRVAKHSRTVMPVGNDVTLMLIFAFAPLQRSVITKDVIFQGILGWRMDYHREQIFILMHGPIIIKVLPAEVKSDI